MHINPFLPKILIIGATPYREDDQSRSQISFFENYDKNNLAQIFSNNRIPLKGLCGNFFQITDKDILKNYFKKEKIGKSFKYDECLEVPDNSKIRFYKKMKHNFLRHWLRYFLWHTKKWSNKKFKEFVKQFNFDYIFFQPSDDYYLFDILKEVLKIKSVPIIFSLVDDYLFLNNTHSLLNKIYFEMYKKTYLKTIKNNNCIPIFITKKMKERYESVFSNEGMVLHVSTKNKLVPFKNEDIIDTIYSGSLGYGRFNSLIVLSNFLEKNKHNFCIHLYPTKISKHQKKRLLKCKNIIIHEKISYSLLQEKIKKSSSILLLEELENKKDIDKVRFSLSTKTADSIYSGKPLIIFSNANTGLASFFKDINIYPIATNTTEIPLIFDFYQNQTIEQKRINQIALFFNSKYTSFQFQKFIKDYLSSKIKLCSPTLLETGGGTK